MIGRTLDTRGAHANPKSGQYYGPHNIQEYIDKGIHVYMRDPQESGKPKWLKDLLRNVLTPLIQAIDPEWAGTDGDWAVQINVINSDKQRINRHVDDKDIAAQYGLALGNFEGGALTLWTKDETSKQTIDLRNRVVRLDGRNYHQVEPVTAGTRYSVYFFKNYDRRWDAVKPHTNDFEIVYVPPAACRDDGADAAAADAAAAASTAAASGPELVESERAEQVEYGKNAAEIAADNMARHVERTVNPVTVESVGAGDGLYYRAVGGTERFTGDGVCYDGTTVLIDSEFNGGLPHGICRAMRLDRCGAYLGTYSGQVANGYPCGAGVLTDGSGRDVHGLYDENGLVLDGKRFYDADAEPGYQKGTLRFIADGDNMGQYTMDSGAGDSVQCDANDAEQYAIAAVTCEMTLDPQSVLTLLQGAFPANTHDENVAIMRADADYLVDGSGTVLGVIAVKTQDAVPWITALAASPQKHGYGRLLVNQKLYKQRKGATVFVQADNRATGFYRKVGFDDAPDVDSDEHCTAMSIVCDTDIDIYMPTTYILDRYQFTQEQTDRLPEPRRRSSDAATDQGRKTQPRRKTQQRHKRKKPGYTEHGRGKFRKMGGTALSGPVGYEQKTCLPDSVVVCMTHQGSSVSKTDARGCMPDDSDPSIQDMVPFVAQNGFAIEPAGEFSCNELKTLSLMSGHYVVLLTLTGNDDNVDKHACALTEVDGKMYIVDNMARMPVLEIGPEDRVSQATARQVFRRLFPGAARLFVSGVFAIKRA